MEIVKEIHKEEGEIQYKCKMDDTILWREFDNGVEVKACSCDHYEWISVGNGCYPIELDENICAGVQEIRQKAVKKIDEGTTIWFLLPKTQ